MATSRTSNPLDLWSQLYDAAETAWDGALHEVLHSEAAAQLMGWQLETWVATQSWFTSMVKRQLATSGWVTQADVAHLGQRLNDLEDQLESIDQRLADFAALLSSRSPVPKPPPAVMTEEAVPEMPERNPGDIYSTPPPQVAPGAAAGTEAGSTAPPSPEGLPRRRRRNRASPVEVETSQGDEPAAGSSTGGSTENGEEGAVWPS